MHRIPDRSRILSPHGESELELVWPSSTEVGLAYLGEDEPFVYTDGKRYWVHAGDAVHGPFRTERQAIAKSGSPRLLINAGRTMLAHEHEAGYGDGGKRLVAVKGGGL